jgi:hypothetical protein
MLDDQGNFIPKSTICCFFLLSELAIPVPVVLGDYISSHYLLCWVLCHCFQSMLVCVLTFLTLGSFRPRVCPECVQQKPLSTDISILDQGRGRSHPRCREDHRDHKVLCRGWRIKHMKHYCYWHSWNSCLTDYF